MIIKRGCNNNKYNDLEIEIKKTLKLKTTFVPVVIGALRLLKMGTENYISKITGNRTYTQEVTIQQVINETYDYPKFME